MAALIPVGDPAYAGLRGALAYGSGDVVALDGTFGLAPGLAPLKGFWDAGELVPVHALAIPYRTRSHFDGQAVLETGLDKPAGASDGWLNRLLQVMDGDRSGIAVAAGMPRSLVGPYPVLSWSPTELGSVEDAYVDRLHVLYARDARLHDRFEAALQLQELQEAEGMAPGMGVRQGAGVQMTPVMEATARFLRDPLGPNIAAVEFSGWYTHANQGVSGGALDRLLGRLADALVKFKSEMGSAWGDTTVVVMTEFGRTARPNGTGGTDHGTAGAGFVLGPGVARSAVLSDWPGLGQRDLYEGRDLRPTLDTRALLKGVVSGVFDLTAGQAERIFPGSESVRAVTGLMG